MKTTVLNIEGMGCSGCVNTIENTLTALPGVKTVIANLEKGIAEVDFDEQEVKEEDFKKAVEEAGYTMTGIQG
ncbi:MAG TPA: heavy-metal-associated domain-containing protein [Gracilimonas sp.]|uniref:heavy-metal-associated domain-containing protein n=1 Tax=Gracilimonas sp. TaxID=1974203 RepID=UPI002D905910|nr:heavy-metal-associated domain-containing protein [Gracilimonas sp.]